MNYWRDKFSRLVRSMAGLVRQRNTILEELQQSYRLLPAPERKQEVDYMVVVRRLRLLFPGAVIVPRLHKYPLYELREWQCLLRTDATEKMSYDPDRWRCGQYSAALAGAGIRAGWPMGEVFGETSRGTPHVLNVFPVVPPWHFGFVDQCPYSNRADYGLTEDRDEIVFVCPVVKVYLVIL